MGDPDARTTALWATCGCAHARALRSRLARQRVADQPDHRRPEADEQCPALGVAALVLIDRLGADPEADAQADAGHRRDLHLPRAQTAAIEEGRQHVSTLPGER